MPDGRYHINNGYTIAATAALRVLKNKCPALVAKDIALALWGSAVLSERSYGGKVAHNDKGNPYVQPRKELTPEKMNVVIDSKQEMDLYVQNRLKKFGTQPATVRRGKVKHRITAS